MSNLSLLNTTNYISVPYVKVQIGEYTFGVYQRTTAKDKDINGFYETTKTIYPNYIQSLNVKKINGKVNTYTLKINYPITQNDDPNFFEKVFSSVNKTRKIVFSYGDMALPTFIYKNEEALITKVQKSINFQSNVIGYTVSATSSATLGLSGSYTFVNQQMKKPSEEIKRILFTKKYGLQEIFTGMTNKALVNQLGLIASDDKLINLETKTNINILDYLTYLVSCMQPASTVKDSVKQNSIYTLVIYDGSNNDNNNQISGTYFKVIKTSKVKNQSDAYEIDIGYPTSNIVTNFNITDNEAYSIYYDYQDKINNNDYYVTRINNKGEEELIYAPNISSNNDLYYTRVNDKTWWTKITEYPISASITLKGLLRPAILMTYVRLNIYFHGKKYVDSGLYIVTSQEDSIDTNGYFTTLSLTRISGDDE